MYNSFKKDYEVLEVSVKSYVVCPRRVRTSNRKLMIDSKYRRVSNEIKSSAFIDKNKLNELMQYFIILGQ